jgi:hypothetical protein
VRDTDGMGGRLVIRGGSLRRRLCNSSASLPGQRGEGAAERRREEISCFIDFLWTNRKRSNGRPFYPVPSSKTLNLRSR